MDDEARAADKRGRRQSEEALSRAYRDFAGVVLAYLRAAGVEDPESVTHDVFLALHPMLATVAKEREGLRTLLFSIAHARIVDHHRRRARHPAPDSYDPAKDLRVVPSAEDQTLALVGNSEAWKLLDGLSEDQREVLTLRVLADLSLEQTAAIMERSVGSVKQLQLRGIRTLRTRLGARKGDRDD